MNTAKQNGSVQGPFFSADLPILRSLKFIPPRRKTRKRHWSFRSYLGKPGIYVIWEINYVKKEQKIIKVADVTNCLYKAAVRSLDKIIVPKVVHRIAFMEVPKGADKKSWLRKNLLLINQELSKIPMPYSHQNYKRMRPYVIRAEVEKSTITSLLKFKPVFTGERTADGRRIRTFSTGYGNRVGTYVIREKENGKAEWIISYVGRSFSAFVERMHHHFYSSPNHPYLVEYSDKLDTHSFEVALIEVPTSGKSTKLFKEETKQLEDMLIKALKPRDNIRGMDKPSKPIWEEPGNEWMKPVSDDDLPF